VFPQARQGRCCFHKTANVLTAPAEVRAPGAKKALAEICGAEDKDHAGCRRGLPPDQGPRRPWSRAAGLAIAFTLIQAVQHRWRGQRARLVALVRAGA